MTRVVKMLPFLLIQIFSLCTFAQSQGQSFSYLTLGITPGVTTQYLPRVDDGASSSIPILGGFPFGASSMANLYVGTNGYFSFGTRQTVYTPSLFSSTSTPNYLVAPFWADIDITVHGSISYEVHSTSAGSSSIALLNRVSTFISNQKNTQFFGNWMLVATWSQVSQVGGSSYVTNTFQGIVITNGGSSYAVFTYECGDINWGGGATIGFKATGSFYQNHAYSGSRAASIDCVNSPTSRWNNVVYRLNGSDGLTGIIVGSILGTLFLVAVFWCIAFCICLQVSTCPLHNIYYKRTSQNLAVAPPIQGQPEMIQRGVTTSHPL